ncbi:hypothetical protein Y1Q_0007293 [Alligator mississippiensis]|uniref:Uncharacterized protein n=1 Tax=Alligator mississippiensis TaxID=8496 RepID=A0A151NNZ3_ALLMI|nr:hypothetical protein Y1Q_0007293 [Alligator mississippiensis]
MQFPKEYGLHQGRHDPSNRSPHLVKYQDFVNIFNKKNMDTLPPHKTIPITSFSPVWSKKSLEKYYRTKYSSIIASLGKISGK